MDPRIQFQHIHGRNRKQNTKKLKTMKKILFFLGCLLSTFAMAADYPQASLAADDETTNTDDAVLVIVENMPEFPGGQSALFQYLKKNMKYPVDAQRNGIQGTVICQFVVEKDGSIAEVEVVKNTSGDASLAKEAIRVINAMPKWNPGEHKGRTVRVRYTFPVRFNLGDASTEQDESEPRKRLEDGDTVRMSISSANNKPIYGFHHELISPNFSYKRRELGETSTAYGIVNVKGDTMTITYYDDETGQKRKQEHYYAKDYIERGADLFLTGTQSYYLDGKLLCEDYLSNGKLKATTWYDKNGLMERRYVFLPENNVMQMQFYPSGAVKMKETYDNSQCHRDVYTENGEIAEWAGPAFPGGFTMFEKYFNRHYRSTMLTVDEAFRATAFIDSTGYCRILLKNGGKRDMEMWEDAMCPHWIPATINGKATSSVISFVLTYQPMLYVQEGDTVNITRRAHMLKKFHGIKWRDHQTWYIASADTCLNYAICHFSGDTLELEGHRKSDNSLFMQQQLLHDQDYGFVNVGFAHRYKNGKLLYSEFYNHYTVDKIVWYHDNQQPHYVITPSDKAFFEALIEYYPTGEVKAREIYDKVKEDVDVQYYSKSGETTTVVEPSYPKGMKALGKYLNLALSQLDLRSWVRKSFVSSPGVTVMGEVNVYYVIDKNGKVLTLDLGHLSVDYRYAGEKTPGFGNTRPGIKDFIKKCLRDNPTMWTPGTIDGKPETMCTKVTIKFSFDARR